MKLLLMSLAAGDVDLIANRASPLGIEIESLTVEASGHFNLQATSASMPSRDPGTSASRAECACRRRVRAPARSPSSEHHASVARRWVTPLSVASPPLSTSR